MDYFAFAIINKCYVLLCFGFNSCRASSFFFILFSETVMLFEAFPLVINTISLIQILQQLAMLELATGYNSNKINVQGYSGVHVICIM